MSMISVIVPHYNDSRFMINWIDRFMDDLLASKQVDLIIVDDCSTDGSFKFIEKLISGIPNAKIIQTMANSGPFKALMEGVKISDSKYISCWSADDEMMPGYLTGMLDAISQYPDQDLFLCNAIVEREGREYKKIGYPFTSFISPDYLLKMCNDGRYGSINIIGNTVRKDALVRCWESGGKYLPSCFDGMFVYFTAFNSGMIILGECLVKYRASFKGFGASNGWEKDNYSAFLIHEYARSEFPEIYPYIMKSGIWSHKSLLWSHLGVNIVPRLPKKIRERVYEHFYGQRF